MIHALPLAPPPLLSIKFFDTRNFVKHKTVPQRRFSVLWDNKFSIQNHDIPLLGIKFFDTRNTEGFLSGMNRYCETKQFWRKIVIPAPSLMQHLSTPEKFCNTEGFLYEIYWHCETKIFQWKIVIPLCIKYRNQWWNWCLWNVFEN